MKLRVLGCSGGIGAGLRTTSFLVDGDILIDAGTGLMDLDLAQLSAIDHVFLTHSHLDHIASLPLLVDSVGALRDKPIQVHALPETIEALRNHIFNWTIWPDFSAIPDKVSPWLSYHPLQVDVPVDVDGRQITPLTANHTVPALGFLLTSSRGSLVFSGDTGPNPAFWSRVNTIENLRHLIMETAFSDSESQLATKAGHLCPWQLLGELSQMTVQPKLWITHLKPSDRQTITREVLDQAAAYTPQVLVNGQILDF